MLHKKMLIACFISVFVTPVANAESDNLKHPDWHPDGRFLISEGSCTGNVGIYLIDTETSAVTLLLDDEFTDGYPRWFSDGKTIVFHQFNGQRHAYATAATVSLSGEISDVRVLSKGPYDIEPAPSPDGSKLLYSKRGKGGLDIAMLDLESGREKVWKNTEADNYASWFPDGESLVYHSKDSDETQIFQRILATYQSMQITHNGSPNLLPDISTDGTTMVFTSLRDGDREIYIKNLSSGREDRLTERTGRDEYPKLSPDQTRIAYHSEFEDAPTVIRIHALEDGSLSEFSCADWLEE